MAAKAFYVSRTETEGQPSGAATLNRADAPQLLKIVPVDSSTGNPDPATPVDNMIYATEATDQEILLTSDTVQSGDLNPVTSDAVYNAIQNLATVPDWSHYVQKTSLSDFPYQATSKCMAYIAFTKGSATVSVVVNGVTLIAPGSNIASVYFSVMLGTGDVFSFTNTSAINTIRVTFVPFMQ